MLNNEKNFRLKSGVSLITVLLFMLVATIAATATYKLLSSGGFSSTSRMRQQEAYQSALAGIENTRMWMTFHANDVGALVKAFIEGGNKPINLDARVRQWQRAKQDYHVWLTGVNTENSTYKLKILSSGVSQIVKDANTEETVAQWNESAIFSVDGLYQVRLLKEEVEEVVASLPFKYNYFGGSTQTQGHMKAYSMLINGDMYGSNPPYTEENLIVTGDVLITGNSVGAGGTACIGGNLNADNGVLGNDFYVGGNAKGFTFPSASEAAGVSRGELKGNVYIEDTLFAPKTSGQIFQKNLTLNGIWETNLEGYDSQVKGNLCLGSKAKVLIEKKKPSRKFVVGENVWAESTYPIGVGCKFKRENKNGKDVVTGIEGNCFEKNEAEPEYQRVVIGDSNYAKIYIKSAHSKEDYVTLVNNRTFVESKDYYRGIPGNAFGVGLQSRWDDKKTRVYKELPPHLRNKTDAYYFYYYDGPGQDVDFIVNTSSGWGLGSQVKYANYYVENQPFYSTGGTFGAATGNHLLNMSGNKPTGSPYCKAGPDKWRPECDVAPWFKSNGTVTTDFPPQRNFECADSVKAHCDLIWRKTPNKGCPHEGSSPVNNYMGRGGKADYMVDDILVTAYKKFETYANYGCRSVTHWGSTMPDKLNECYRENLQNGAKRAMDSLYNGYQVVKVKSKGLANPKTPLKGKFIIIMTDPMGQQNLPPTTSDSYVFLYLVNGTGHGGGNTYTLMPAVPGGIYNYFIYTPKDIDGLMFNNEVFSGSIYAKAANCAKVGDIKTRRMDFNEALMNDLTANAVLCPAATATEDNCGGAGVTSSSSGGTSSASAESGSSVAMSEFDSFYISMAPQLSVRLESQGKSKEPLPEPGDDNVTVLSPSFIVLPRIIYLPSDPYGSLTDYYNVQALNGSALKKNDVNVSCTGPSSLPTTGKLYTAPAKLAKGLYTCTATASNHPNVPFWVSVGDSARATAVISFEKDVLEMRSSMDTVVNLNVSAHGSELVVNVHCPNVDNSAWSYVSFGTNVTRNGTTCTVTLPATTETSTITLATVKTTNAVEGTMLFQLLPGDGYIPGTPNATQLFIKSIAQLNRGDVTSEDIAKFCQDNSSVCPDGYSSYWPDCDVAGVWVEPTGTFINKEANESWAIMVGNPQPITLTEVSGSGCVVIIPTDNNSIAANGVQANTTYTLRASAKAPKRTLTVGFSGDVGGNGRDPMIHVYTTHGSETQLVKTCRYSEASASSETSSKRCTASIFKGEKVTVILDDSDAQDFSFWKCTGSSCPTTDATVTSKEYGSFMLSDDETEVIAVFGEKDKHCFFDEFKRETVECDATESEYCIDKCSETDATSVCTAADATGIFAHAKWHLISGILSQIITGPSGEIHIEKSVIKKKKQTAREPIVVMSTVNAGVVGTLKALINVPRANSSYDKSAVNIKQSGFMLRANKFGNDYFMLNLYENNNGVLEAQLSRGTTSLSATLMKDDGFSTAHVSNSKMVMMTAEITALDTLKVRASIGNYYDSPEEYKCVFALSEFNNTLSDVAHEYVGFSLADPNFKIYGIGWKSGTYNSECHDTYPTVKCSFAAVSTDGVIKTGVDVKPWVGHSGWFDSKGCSPLYYYNGDDACLGGTCDSYNFSESGIGAHGYTVVDNDTKEKTEVKTAKAWLGNCTNVSDDKEVEWGKDAVSQRAHCGAFWTGNFSECSAHQDLFSGSKPVNYGMEETVVFENKQNLRAATLHITLENTDKNEVEIWLVSESENWGDSDHESHSVKMDGNSATFDVMQEFATGSSGFDPENVKQIVLKNHGLTSATLTSITSSCANAIGITYCRADFDGDKWNVTTQVTNKDLVTKEQVVATVEGGSYGFNETRDATGSNGIVWNGDIALITIPDPRIYTHHKKKHYVFNATITGSSPGQTASKQCAVSPDPIGDIGVNCSVVGSIASGVRFPTFNIDFNGCPGTGCGYEVYIDSQKFVEGVEKTSARHSANQSEECSVTAGCEHSYTVKSTTTPELFDECSATFKVLRKEEEVPPTVTCGISTNPNGFSTDPVFEGNRLYFLARNNESVDKEFSLILKQENTQVGTATLQKWSNLTNVKDLGTGLAKGTHSYSLYVDDEKVCDASVTVNDISGACTIGGKLYTGQQISVNVSGVNANTQFTWTLKNGAQTVGSRTIDCGTANCWNNTMNAPGTAGTYTYTVTKGSNTICESSIVIDPILSCSVSPTEVGRGVNYTFTANAAVNCRNCSFTDDAGSTENNLGIQENASWTKTKPAGNSIGDKTLRFNCNSCNNNANASCTASLKVKKTAPTFSCADNLKATVNKDDNVKIRLKDITNCDDDDACSYSISGIGSDASTYTGCTNTNCGLNTITNKTTTGGNTETYAVTLTNSIGSTTENCSVEFIAGPTCKVVTWNPNAGQTPDNTGGGSWSPSLNWTGECFDITTTGYKCSGDIQIKADDCKGETLDWNTSTVTLQTGDGYYAGRNPAAGSTIHIAANKSCTISQLYLTGCRSANTGSDDGTLDLSKDCNDNTGAHAFLEDGKDYKVTAVGSCTNIKFNCPYGGGGCSIRVNGNTATNGADNSSNNNLSPMPTVNDILHVTGDVSKICCAIGW